MLSEVLGIVEARRWFDTTLPFEKSIYLSQGSSQCMLLSRNGLPDTFVKFTNLVDLASEAARCRQSHERFPQHTAQFLGYAKQHSLNVLATRAVNFHPVSGLMMLGAKSADQVHAGLEGLFRRMSTCTADSGDHKHENTWFEDLRKYFDGHALQPAVGMGLQRLGQALQTLPPIPQHGDLVLNNLGLRPDRELVVFDWEDYDAVALPGLDLFTLDYSIRQDLNPRLVSELSTVSTRALDIGRLAAALGLSRQLYEELKLSYALVFRYLKRNYNAEVRARLDELILGMAGAIARNESLDGAKIT